LQVAPQVRRRAAAFIVDGSDNEILDISYDLVF
jgi:hypothetical protein